MTTLKINWNQRKIIVNKQDIFTMIDTFKQCKPDLSSFDTETTGLHIILDKPFMYQFGFANTITKQGYTYIIDLREDEPIKKQAIMTCFKLAENSTYLIGANVKYDLHMTNNISIRYTKENVIDTQVLIRLAHDAIPVKRGGPPLSLKAYSQKYIDPDARFHESELRIERAEKVKVYNEPLKKIAREHGMKWLEFEKWLKDAINQIEDLPEPLQTKYLEWYQSLPQEMRIKMREHYVTIDDILYSSLNKENLYMYGSFDVIYPIEIAHALLPILKIRGQMDTLRLESDVMWAFIEMEATGMAMNKPYIKESELKLRKYIIKRRRELVENAGQEVTSSQNKLIKEILQTKFGLEMESTDAEALDDALTLLMETDGNQQAIDFIEGVQELRTLEKWYKTYLIRFVKEAEFMDTIHTQINQAGAVTGRVSSDFQQFPKGSIKDNLGNVLYTPRKMIQKPDDVELMVWMDYSQIELRFQAFYTILIGSPDLNLCRAYMPYQCHMFLNNVKVGFDFTNKTHIQNYRKYDWYYDEIPDKHWEPTDVHGATTQHAFPDLDVDSKEFQKWRGAVGKRTNFAKNYGASRKALKSQFKKFKFSEEKITEIDEAYFKAFPGVKEYMSYCYRLAAQGYMTNMFGRSYFGISGHNGMNALVQGSAADFLKLAIVKIRAWIKENNIPIRLVMTIHDEIVFYFYKDAHLYMGHVRDIMEDFPEAYVPIIAEVETSVTTWDEAEGVEVC